VDLTGDDSGQVFFVMNRTGHNGPLSQNCGTRPIQVLITFITPTKEEKHLLNGDTQARFTVAIDKGEKLTVQISDPNEERVFVTKGKIFPPPVCPAPVGYEPIIRICPETEIEFRDF